MIFRKIAIIFLLAFAFSTFAQNVQIMGEIDLENTPYSRLSVLNGRVLCPPQKTDFGYAVLAEGRTLSAFFPDGKILWQKTLPSNPEFFFCACEQGFFAVPLKNGHLAFLNQSGNVVWKKDAGFRAEVPPVFGRDGRIFLFGGESASCFGLNGTQKWKIHIKPINSNLPPAKMEDGSLILFESALEEGKTVGIRLSPFGEILERIVFSKKIIASFSCKNGVLLAFDDGSVELCSLDQKQKKICSKSKWTIKNLSLKDGAKFLKMKDGFVAIANPENLCIKIHILDVFEKCVLRSFDANEIAKPIRFSFESGQFFVADEKKGAIFTEEGKLLRKAKFPQKNGTIDQVFYENGKIVFLTKSWNLVTYKILYESPVQKKVKEKSAGYENCFDAGQINSENLLTAPRPERKTALQKGLYGHLEKDFWIAERFIIEEYLSEKMKIPSKSKSSISREPSATLPIEDQISAISVLGLFESADAAFFLQKIIFLESDEQILISALNSAKFCPYDADGKLFLAIESVILKAPPKSAALIFSACDALYSICAFMGNANLCKKAISILSNLLSPQYERTVKENARFFQKKLAKLNIM